LYSTMQDEGLATLSNHEASMPGTGGTRVRKGRPREARTHGKGVSLPFHALEVLFVQELIDGFLDVCHLWVETRRELGDDLLDQLLVLERLARLHDSDNDGLCNSALISPHSRRGKTTHLNDELPVLVDVLEHICCFCLGLCLDGHVQVDTDLLIKMPFSQIDRT
jgi:hypothetical protein